MSITTFQPAFQPTYDESAARLTPRGEFLPLLLWDRFTGALANNGGRTPTEKNNGNTWNNVGGDWKIENGVLTPQGAAPADPDWQGWIQLASGQTDHQVEVTIVSNSTTKGGITFRGVDSSDFYSFLTNNAGAWALKRWASSAWSDVATGTSLAAATPGKIVVKANGTTAKCFVNGNLITSQTVLATGRLWIGVVAEGAIDFDEFKAYSL